MRKRTDKIRVDCPECRGTGYEPCLPEESFISLNGQPVKECKKCQNSGQIEEMPEEREFEPEDN
jgi:DnaJ-class molecular chaperone